METSEPLVEPCKIQQIVQNGSGALRAQSPYLLWISFVLKIKRLEDFPTSSNPPNPIPSL